MAKLKKFKSTLNKQKPKRITIDLYDEAIMLESIAKKENYKNKSDLVRDLIKTYYQQEFEHGSNLH